MDEREFTLALAAILSTLAAAIFVPLVSGYLQRKIARDSQIRDRRLDAYAELLEVLQHLVDNAQYWSSLPQAEGLSEPSEERLRSITSRIRVVGSERVWDKTQEAAAIWGRFLSDLFPARLKHDRVRRETGGDTVETIGARLELGKLADQLRAAVKEIEEQVRTETEAR
jgi:hypothetical protein